MKPLTARELAVIWNCTAAEIRQFAKEGMPHIKSPSGQYFFNLKDCQQWWAGQI